MRRRGDGVPPAGLVLDGRRFASVEAWQRAKDARDDRRARLMAGISVERGELLEAPGVSADAVRAYCTQLEAGWSAERGWRDVEL